MTPQLMIQPSTLLASGIEARPFGDVTLFRFTTELQDRSDALIQRAKLGPLTADEEAELVGISELSRIFTFINAQLSAKASWCPTKLDDGFNNVPAPSASTATPPNT
jgi:hypothetical protein